MTFNSPALKQLLDLLGEQGRILAAQTFHGVWNGDGVPEGVNINLITYF